MPMRLVALVFLAVCSIAGQTMSWEHPIETQLSCFTTGFSTACSTSEITAPPSDEGGDIDGRSVLKRSASDETTYGSMHVSVFDPKAPEDFTVMKDGDVVVRCQSADALSCLAELVLRLSERVKALEAKAKPQ